MPDVVKIPLRSATGAVRAYATVDAADGELAELRWTLTSHGYAKRTVRENGRKVCYYLHRVVTGAPRGQDVDHINRDRLDCRRSNLRLCTRGENLQNTAGRGGTSRHRGVSMHRPTGKWRADVKVHGKQHFLGLFVDEDEAASAAAEARARLMTHATC